MIRLTRREDCTGCGACAAACPHHCIHMQQDAEGFAYPVVDAGKCIECGLCEKTCPVLNNREEERKTTAYAAVSLDNDIRLNSSSGGVFSMLAQNVLREGGVVFGAAMSDDCRTVFHTAVEADEELSRLRGSKYVQSDTRKTFEEARTHLKAGRKVLYCGTPCQIAGLKAYLKTEEENLLCLDLACHGVPSPKVWGKYVDWIETREGKVRNVSFRNKTHGWRAYEMQIQYENEQISSEFHAKDFFIHAFLHNASLRPSCYECRFKMVSRSSDLTLADFWGVHNVLPEMDDDRGTSLVLVHTEKGRKALEGAELYLRQTELSRALKSNMAIVRSVRAHKNRSEFFAYMDTLEFDELVQKYAAAPLTARRLAVKVLKKLKLLEFAKRLLGKT